MHLVAAVRFTALLAIGMALCALPACAQNAAQIARGRYLIKIGGCNDCTPTVSRKATPRRPKRTGSRGARSVLRAPGVRPMPLICGF